MTQELVDYKYLYLDYLLTHIFLDELISPLSRQEIVQTIKFSDNKL